MFMQETQKDCGNFPLEECTVYTTLNSQLFILNVKHF